MGMVLPSSDTSLARPLALHTPGIRVSAIRSGVPFPCMRQGRARLPLGCRRGQGPRTAHFHNRIGRTWRHPRILPLSRRSARLPPATDPDALERPWTPMKALGICSEALWKPFGRPLGNPWQVSGGPWKPKKRWGALGSPDAIGQSWTPLRALGSSWGANAGRQVVRGDACRTAPRAQRRS